VRNIAIRDRGIIGTDIPLDSEYIGMLPGESIDVAIPFGQVIPIGIIVQSVGWSTKHGSGVSMSNVVISSNQRDVEGTVAMASTDASKSQLIGVAVTLSSGETWEINVPFQLCK